MYLNFSLNVYEGPTRTHFSVILCHYYFFNYFFLFSASNINHYYRKKNLTPNVSSIDEDKNLYI